jgi:site-specific DNA recombinase
VGELQAIGGVNEKIEGHGKHVLRPPFGYRKEIIERQEGHKRTRVISRPVVDEKTAPVVQRIFELYDQGNGYEAIAMTLNAEGYRTNKGHRFDVMFISRTLHNRAYIGTLDYNRNQTRGAKEPISIPGFYPPIVDEKLFYQKIISKMPSRTVPSIS